MRSCSRFLVRLALALPLLLLAAACGGSGGGTPEIVLTGVTVFNSTLTSAGGANTHSITRVDALGPGPQNLTYFPTLAPGASVFVPLGTGSWFLAVTYSDGTHETGQVAADPISLTAGDNLTVAFLY